MQPIHWLSLTLLGRQPLLRVRLAALLDSAQPIGHGFAYEWTIGWAPCSFACQPPRLHPPWMKHNQKTKPKKLATRSAKKPARRAASMSKQHLKQSLAVRGEPIVDPIIPVAGAASEGQRSMSFLLFWPTLPLRMMSMWWRIGEARNAT